jgi:phenylalanyl-tRNA synthetase beta chain
VDLIEELARVHGYDHLPVRSIRAELPLAARPERRLSMAALRRVLTARGYQEAITYSFVDPKLQTLLAPGQPVVELRNPISADMSIMRTTLWAGLLNTLGHNLNRQQQRGRLFETGLRFLPAAEGLPRQEKMLALVATGRRHSESWTAGADQVDFYDVKGDLEAILALARVDGTAISYRPGSHAALHPGQSADVLRDGRLIGHIGALHPEVQQQLGIDQPVFLLEIELAGIDEGMLPTFSELSRFPEVRRDLALLVDRAIPAEAVLGAAREAAGEHLRNLTLFDVYQGKGIDPQRKSLALGLTFQHSSRTLTEDEVNTTVDAVVGVLKERLAATLRN